MESELSWPTRFFHVCVSWNAVPFLLRHHFSYALHGSAAQSASPFRTFVVVITTSAHSEAFFRETLEPLYSLVTLQVRSFPSLFGASEGNANSRHGMASPRAEEAAKMLPVDQQLEGVWSWVPIPPRTQQTAPSAVVATATAMPPAFSGDSDAGSIVVGDQTALLYNLSGAHPSVLFVEHAVLAATGGENVQRLARRVQGQFARVVVLDTVGQVRPLSGRGVLFFVDLHAYASAHAPFVVPCFRSSVPPDLPHTRSQSIGCGALLHRWL